MELWEMGRYILTALVVACAMTNLTNSLSMAHTWKHWRQIKWYILMLMIGNWLELFFNISLRLREEIIFNLDVSDASCKFLKMMTFMGPSLSGMAIAALALHVLLTAITGCQGNRVRHGLVIGLFVLLSLPLPLSKIAMYETKPFSEDSRYCAYIGHSESADIFCTSTSLVFFPASVWLGCIIPSVVMTATKSKGNTKGDENLSDVVITGLLGLLFLICCLPLNIFLVKLALGVPLLRVPDLNLWAGLNYLDVSRNFISAIVVVVFAYVTAFRRRREGSFAPATDTTARGERQKLVN